MSGSKVTTKSFEDRGFSEVHTDKKNETEFSKEIPGDKVIRARVFRNPTNQSSAIVNTWIDNYSTGSKENHKSSSAIPDSPRIKAKIGI